MTIERLTPRDKANIEIMAEWQIPSNTRRALVRFDADLDILLAHGFELGFTGASAFGTSKDGVDWQVTTVPKHRIANNGQHYRTVWYTIDKEYRRTPALPFSIEQFYERF